MNCSLFFYYSTISYIVWTETMHDWSKINLLSNHVWKSSICYFYPSWINYIFLYHCKPMPQMENLIDLGISRGGDVFCIRKIQHAVCFFSVIKIGVCVLHQKNQGFLLHTCMVSNSTRECMGLKYFWQPGEGMEKIL